MLFVPYVHAYTVAIAELQITEKQQKIIHDPTPFRMYQIYWPPIFPRPSLPHHPHQLTVFDSIAGVPSLYVIFTFEHTVWMPCLPL